MSGDPGLRIHRPRGEIRGVAVVLHGGRSESSLPVRPSQVAVLRMIPFDRALRHAGARHGLAVVRLLFRVRGWNGRLESPVHDARWALDRIRDRFPAVPISLLGHSMGGRAALRVADDESVTAVVAVAPWLPAGEPVNDVEGARILIMHGTRDRMTDPRTSAAWAVRARAAGAQVSYVSVRGARHAMLRRARLAHDLASGFILGALWDMPAAGTADGPATNPLRRALAGEPSLVV